MFNGTSEILAEITLIEQKFQKLWSLELWSSINAYCRKSELCFCSQRKNNDLFSKTQSFMIVLVAIYINSFDLPVIRRSRVISLGFSGKLWIRLDWFCMVFAWLFWNKNSKKGQKSTKLVHCCISFAVYFDTESFLFCN